MHVFVSRALQKILRECPKKHAALRQSCIDVIGALPCLPEELRHASLPPTLFPRTPRLAEDLKKNGAESFPPPGDAEAGSPPSTPLPADVPSEREAPATQAEKDDAAGAAGLDDGDGADGTPMGDGELGSRMSACSMSDLGSPGAGGAADTTARFFEPLRLACESKLPRIMEVALHCTQKLIAYGYVRGKVVQAGAARRGLMDVVMETVRLACRPRAPARARRRRRAPRARHTALPPAAAAAAARRAPSRPRPRPAPAAHPPPPAPLCSPDLRVQGPGGRPGPAADHQGGAHRRDDAALGRPRHDAPPRRQDVLLHLPRQQGGGDPDDGERDAHPDAQRRLSAPRVWRRQRVVGGALGDPTRRLPRLPLALQAVDEAAARPAAVRGVDRAPL